MEIEVRTIIYFDRDADIAFNVNPYAISPYIRYRRFLAIYSREIRDESENEIKFVCERACRRRLFFLHEGSKRFILSRCAIIRLAGWRQLSDSCQTSTRRNRRLISESRDVQRAQHSEINNREIGNSVRSRCGNNVERGPPEKSVSFAERDFCISVGIIANPLPSAINPANPIPDESR